MSQEKERIFGLDVIRAGAVLLVVFHHTFSFTNPPAWVRFFGPLGSLGAEALLVLSGYLIGHGLMQKARSGRFSTTGHLGQFFYKRWMRTLPPYYFYLLIMAAILPPFFHQLYVHRAYFLFLQNFAWKMPNNFYAQTWTLAVLEFFYLLFPLVLFLTSKVVRNYLVCFFVPIALFLIVPLVIRLFHTQVEDARGFEDIFRKCVVYRLDMPIAGVIIALIEIEWPHIWARLLRHCWIGLVVFGACMTYYFLGFPYLFSNHWMQVFFFPVVSIAIALMFPLMCSWKMRNTLFHSTVCSISQVSYSIYVCHYFALSIGLCLLIMCGISQDKWIEAYFIFGICLSVIAYLSYHLAEAPFMRLRDSKLPQKSYFLSLYRAAMQKVKSWLPTPPTIELPSKPAEMVNE